MITNLTRAALVLVSVIALSGILLAFYYEDWKYSQPTPHPEGLEQPAIASLVDLTTLSRLSGEKITGPLWVHFYNPKCPCSRFTTKHIEGLIEQYGQQIRVVVVRTAGNGRGPFPAEIEDKDGEIGKAFGVYSTPQAVLIDAEGRLYYRGNYNRSRLCQDRKTEYARIALERLLDHRPPGLFDTAATTAYGCPLIWRRSAL